MTGKKTTVEFTEQVMPLIEYWRQVGVDLRDMINAGIVLFHEASPEKREAAMATANRASAMPLVPGSDGFAAAVRAFLREEFGDTVLEELRARRSSQPPEASAARDLSEQE